MRDGSPHIFPSQLPDREGITIEIFPFPFLVPFLHWGDKNTVMLDVIQTYSEVVFYFLKCIHVFLGSHPFYKIKSNSKKLNCFESGQELKATWLLWTLWQCLGNPAECNLKITLLKKYHCLSSDVKNDSLNGICLVYLFFGASHFLLGKNLVTTIHYHYIEQKSQILFFVTFLLKQWESEACHVTRKAWMILSALKADVFLM